MRVVVMCISPFKGNGLPALSRTQACEHTTPSRLQKMKGSGLGSKATGFLCFSGAAVTQFLGLRVLVTKRYMRSVRTLSALAGGPRAIPLSASEDDDDRFAKRRNFFDQFVAEHGMHEARFKFIHVTGTKGKGTVCELVRCGLVANGRRVGTFTSPHLHSVRERIRVGKRCIPQSDFTRLWQRVQDAFKGGDTQSWAVFFDKVLALALAFFIEEKVEYVILEVGIGGRYDSTNFITDPAACVITSISLDHTDMLGDKIEMIAWQKAGIIKKGCVALTTSSQPAAALEVIRREADSQDATLMLIDPQAGGGGGKEPRQNHHHFGAQLIQAENLALARAVMECLGFEARGFDKAYWPGRFEVLDVSPTLSVVVDAAHNTESVEKTLQEVEDRFPDSLRVCIFGTGVDKDQKGMIEAVCRHADRLALVQASHPRAAKVDALAQWATTTGSQCQVSKDTPKVPEAMAMALADAAREEGGGRKVVIVALGSFYVVSAVRAYMAEREPRLFRPDDWAFQCDETEEDGGGSAAQGGGGSGTLMLFSALGLRHTWRRARAWVVYITVTLLGQATNYSFRGGSKK